jgi:hypothetical protein
MYGWWPVDEATHEPIKDETHPKRLRGMKDAKFESFDVKDGKRTSAVERI